MYRCKLKARRVFAFGCTIAYKLLRKNVLVLLFVYVLTLIGYLMISFSSPSSPRHTEDDRQYDSHNNLAVKQNGLVYIDPNTGTVGQAFSPVWNSYLLRLNLIRPSPPLMKNGPGPLPFKTQASQTVSAVAGNNNIETKEPAQQHHQGYGASSGVITIVTACDHSHWTEELRMIRTAFETHPNALIEFYDLGLLAYQRMQLEGFSSSKSCRLRYHKFPFYDYPPWMAHLEQYRWKPIILAENLLKHGQGFYWMDASVRMKPRAKDQESFFNSTRYQEMIEGKLSPVLLQDVAGHSIFAATHPGMFQFFPMNQTLAKRVGMRGATLQYWIDNEESREILQWNVLCALESKCMAPAGSHLLCHFAANDGDRFGLYANCHRFDQSALNIILANNEYHHQKNSSNNDNTKDSYGYWTGLSVAIERETENDSDLLYLEQICNVENKSRNQIWASRFTNAMNYFLHLLGW